MSKKEKAAGEKAPAVLKGKRKMQYNFSKDSDYHTQINNKVMPLSTCNTTSMIMALKQAGHHLEHPPTLQPEDYLTGFLNNPLALDTMKTLTPWAWDTNKDRPIVPPQEVHQMLQWAVNTLLKKEACRFTLEAKLSTLVANLLTGGGIVLSGLFPTHNGRLAHMVSLAGFTTDNDKNHVEEKNITGFIIDDPFGNFRTSYKDPRGNNIHLSKKEFLKIFKSIDNKSHKWAHVVRPVGFF